MVASRGGVKLTSSTSVANDLHVIEQREHVVGDVMKREDLRRIRRAAVAALIRRNQTVSLRRRREDVSPVVARAEATVEKQERLAVTDDVVAEGNSVGV